MALQNEQNEKEAELSAQKAQRGISLAEGIRTFSAAVGTTAVLLLTLCGILNMLLPAEEENVQTASLLGSTTLSETKTVQLGGEVFGIRMYSDGLIVAALSEIYTDNKACCPAKDAGIQVGDYVLAANGKTVETNSELADVFAKGQAVTLTMRREDQTYETTVTPAYSGDSFRAGMWVRDSAAGIGTVTFYSADGSSFAALGHGICDADTKEILMIREGEPAAITICGIQRGRSGEPGRLRGFFSSSGSLGSLTSNTELGIYGTLSDAHDGQTIEVLDKSAVHTGAVQIAATIDDSGVQLFDAELERVSPNAKQETKTLILHITDAELLDETGGIVQGMSGCPILQDGKLAGAITHVFIDDPTRGYGIFAEDMLNTAA